MTHEEQHDKNNNINSAEALERALQQMDDPEAIAAAIGMPGLSDLVNRLGDMDPLETSSIDTGVVTAEEVGAADFTKAEIDDVVQRLEKIDVLTPRQVEQRLLECGYRGQKKARRAGSVLAYRHLQRLRLQFLEQLPTDELPEREHYMFLGTTGSGKTYLAELLFREILPVPTLVADTTRFSETGYIGDDVQMLISHLFELAGQNRAWASCGVVCLDEFDKLATSRSSTRFAGEGTTKDVSGFGVQRGLLTLLSGRTTTFPADFGYSGHGAQVEMPLRNIMFIACGAFSGLQGTATVSKSKSSVGFGQVAKPKIDEGIAQEVGSELMENTTAFANYGMLPELVGRFSRLVSFQPLTEEVLREILDDTLLDKYRREFKREGVELVIEDPVIEGIVEAAHRRETGARGLRASLVPHLEEAAFETFGTGKQSKVTLKKKGDDVIVVTK